jgi:hypothetical protein
VVAAATAASSGIGSSRGRARGESPVHTESKPAASASRANPTTLGASCSPVIAVSRLGSSTPARMGPAPPGSRRSRMTAIIGHAGAGVDYLAGKFG